MRRFLSLLLALLVSSSLFAQRDETSSSSAPSTGVTSGESRVIGRGNSWSKPAFTSMVGYGNFALSNEDRFGPMIVLQYTPNRHWRPEVNLIGGVLIRTGNSDPTDQRGYIPVASQFASPYSPYSDYYNNGYYERPHFSIGMAFLGGEMTYYLTQGNVRPYVGVGASFAFWSYLNRFSGALAPSAKGGLDVRISNSFSGFAELRRMFGVANFVGPSTPKFDGLTAAAIGISFVPELR
jgi:hypothetical protein